MTKQILAFLSFATLSLIPSLGDGGNMQSWRKYFFDGKEFREGVNPPMVSVYFKEGFLPVIRTESEAHREDRLPAGTGGLVVFCYIESAGGKFQNHSGYAPFAGAAVGIKSSGKTMIIRSDKEGYAILALPAETYEVRVKGFIKKVRVEDGKTAFATIRAGKRMVD